MANPYGKKQGDHKSDDACRKATRCPAVRYVAAEDAKDDERLENSPSHDGVCPMSAAIDDPIHQMLREGELTQILSELPSFVKPALLPQASEPLNLNHFHFWSPEQTGDPAIDYIQGDRHFLSALAYAQREESPLLIFLTIMAMRAGGIRPMERGFIDAAASKAVGGAMPPAASEEWIGIVARSTQAAAKCRTNETSMSSAIKLTNPRSAWHVPGLASSFLIHLLMSNSGPIELAVWMMAGAALNGSKQ